MTHEDSLLQSSEAAALIRSPLEHLGISVRLRRALITAGVGTLGEAFGLPRSRTVQLLGYDLAKQLADLEELFEGNPQRFVTAVKRDPGEATRLKASAGHQDTRAANSPRSPLRRCLSGYSEEHQLSELNRRVRQAIARGLATDEDLLVWKLFEELESDVARAEELFRSLFQQHVGPLMPLAKLIEDRYPDALLLLFASLAVQCHEGNGVWGPLFERVGVPGESAFRAKLKHVFYNTVETRGLRRYERGSEDFCYFYTALLHGGFSTSFWESLWEGYLFPWAQRRAGTTQVTQDEVTQACLELRTEAVQTTLGRVVAKLLNATPLAELETLMKPALEGASELQRRRLLRVPSCDESPVEVVPAMGLGAGADKALEAALAKTFSRTCGTLPSARLCLDLEAQRLELQWRSATLPKAFDGCSLVFRANGVELGTVAVWRSGPSVPFSGFCAPVAQAHRFDVEVLLVRDGHGGRQEVVSRAQQHFSQWHQGLFHFVEHSAGLFLLRRAGSRLTDTRRLAFLPDPGLRVQGGPGMLAEDELPGDDERPFVQLFLVQPGASGSLVEADSGEALASWQDAHRVSLSRDGTIGSGPDGQDLYGFAPDSNGFNTMLPRVYVEGPAAAGDSLRDGLSIWVECDGALLGVPCRWAHDEETKEGMARLVIDLPQASLPPLVERGVLVVALRGGSELLRYRFSVVPISSVSLIEAWMEGPADCRAAYQVDAPFCISLQDEGYTWPMGGSESPYEFEAPLADASRTVTISLDRSALRGTPMASRRLSLPKGVEAHLDLAALEVRMSPSLFGALKNGELLRWYDCSVYGVAVDGTVTVRARGRRPQRSALLLVGEAPVAFEQFNGAGAMSIDALAERGPFAERRVESAPFDVSLALYYGVDSRVEAPKLCLARCEAGPGLGRLAVIGRAGSRRLLFSHGAPRPYEMVLYDRRRDYVISRQAIGEGDTCALLPPEAAAELSRGLLRVDLVPQDIFGEADFDNTFHIEMTG